MINMIIGFFVGCALTVVGFQFFTDSKFDGNLVVNIVIALATCVATGIHISSVLNQRKEKIWELNKGLLLELADSLHNVIKSCERARDLESQAQEDGKKFKYTDVGFSASEELDRKIEYATNVYASLMDEKLLKSLQEYSEFCKINTSAVLSDELDNAEGYEQIIDKSKIMHKKVTNFIANVSGVKNS